MPTRLLMIDDDTRLAAMVSDYLRAAGFEVDTAASLAAGRDRLFASAPMRCPWPSMPCCST